MSTPLHEIAARELRALGATSGEGAVRRLTMDIEVEGRTEMVTVRLRGDELQCVSSDGVSDGPHVMAALRFIAGTEQRDEAPAPLLSIARPSREQIPQNELAEALDDLLTAVTRVGVNKAQHAPSVDTALERVIRVAPQPTPPGLGRFIGRLQQEIGSGEFRRVARILDGATQLTEALRLKEPTRESELRLAAWLGTPPGSAPKTAMLYDRTMIEVGREWLSGTERASVERRYLVDTRSGSVYREDRPRNASASLGPCPRQLQVGLAEVEGGPTPQRIHVLQYEVQAGISESSWERLQQVASRDFADVTDRYRRSVQAHPSLSEPFALVAPYRIECNGVFKAFDADGHQLLLNRSERRGAVLAFYELLAQGVQPSWVAGRLTDTGSTVSLTPFALGTREGSYKRL